MGKKEKRVAAQIDASMENDVPESHEKQPKKKRKNREKVKEPQNVAVSLVSEAPTLSIALPGSIIDNAQSLELATRLAGQIARAATIFRIDEVVIFDSKSVPDDASTDILDNDLGENESGTAFLIRILRVCCPHLTPHIIYASMNGVLTGKLFSPVKFAEIGDFKIESFVERCYYCKKRIAQNKEVFMYVEYIDSVLEKDCLPQVGKRNMMNKRMVNDGNSWICINLPKCCTKFLSTASVSYSESMDDEYEKFVRRMTSHEFELKKRFFCNLTEHDRHYYSLAFSVSPHSRPGPIRDYANMGVAFGRPRFGRSTRCVGHNFPVILILAVLHIFSSSFKLKQNGWIGNFALGASYISLPWWAGQALFGTLTPDIIVLTLLYSIAGLGIAIVNDFKSVEGDRKMGLQSSAIPKKVDIIEGMHVISVACGSALSLVVVDRTKHADKLEQLEVYDGVEAIEAPDEKPDIAKNKSIRKQNPEAISCISGKTTPF
ncbi:hypothetical protein CASFOL_039253 [Castilleja foliolosa]|uniref:FLZ-type domain-containing protein n=1 Tax=Castilleja foliolosa TaxID=1961234 RepID=A0ABD3BHZ1_9LAMI